MDKDACNPWYSTVTSTPPPPSLSLSLSLSRFSHNNPRSCEGYLKRRRRNAIYVFASYFGEYQQQLFMFFFHWKKNRQSSARPGWPCPSPTSLNNAYAASLFRFRSLRLRGHTHPYCINLPVPAPAAAMRWTYRDSVRGLQVGRSKEFWLLLEISESVVTRYRENDRMK
jgi:hypothetical protein